MNSIKAFKGQNYFLSNFYPCRIEYEGKKYASVECAYQAAKTLDPDIRYYFTVVPNSAEAKELGRTIELRDDWEDVKLNIMYELLKLKFKDAKLQDKLLATEDAHLEEGNFWGDKYWGTVKGQGENNLGKLLMKVRKEINESKIA